MKDGGQENYENEMKKRSKKPVRIALTDYKMGHGHGPDGRRGAFSHRCGGDG